MSPTNLKHRKDENFVQFYQLENACNSDFVHLQGSSRNLPCKKCRISLTGAQSVIALSAETKEDLAILSEWIRLVDQPKESLIVTLYCIVVQDHQIDRFLSSLLHESQRIFSGDLHEGLSQLLTEMEREFGVSLVASPRVVFEIGSSAKLKTQEEFKLNSDEDGMSYFINLAIDVGARKKGLSHYSLDINFQQNLTTKSTYYGLVPTQLNEIRTQVTVQKGELYLLGSAGQWSSVTDRGTFNLLRILPDGLIPYFYKQQGGKSQLMIFIQCQ